MMLELKMLFPSPPQRDLNSLAGKSVSMYTCRQKHVNCLNYVVLSFFMKELSHVWKEFIVDVWSFGLWIHCSIRNLSKLIFWVQLIVTLLLHSLLQDDRSRVFLSISKPLSFPSQAIGACSQYFEQVRWYLWNFRNVQFKVSFHTYYNTAVFVSACWGCVDLLLFF